MTEFWNGPGQDSKSTLQHNDQHGNNTKLIKIKDHNLKHKTYFPHTHDIFVNFRWAFYQI